MNQDLLNQAIQLFDTDEKWNSFLELSYNKETIKNNLWKYFQSSMNENFAKHDLVDGWSFCSDSPKQYRWFLTEFGKESCGILMDEGKNVSLRAHPDNINLELVRSMLSTEKFSVLFNFLERIDLIGTVGHWEFIRESGNFIFGSSFDKNFPNDDRLTWFAGNRTADFVDQISEKVNRIRKDESMTFLLQELNKVGKK